MTLNKGMVVLLLLLIGWIALPLGLSQEMDAPRPIDGINSVLLEELTWMEVRDALREGTTSVIVATGGIEQNGPNVATGKHNYVLQATTEAIARKLGNTLVAPIIKFVPEGTIDPPTGHMQYPGTISLSVDTFKYLLLDICRSLKQHGFTDLILIGDSGGNQKGMEAVAEQLNTQWVDSPTRAHYIPEYYEQDIWSFDYLKTIGIFQQPDVKSAARAGIHSDYHYESIMATMDPTLIRAYQRMLTGTFRTNGVELAPLSKTIANGKKLVEYRAQITVAAIQKAMK